MRRRGRRRPDINFIDKTLSGSVHRGKKLCVAVADGQLDGMAHDTTAATVDDSLLESAALCLDLASVRALGGLKLGATAQARLDELARKANEGQLAADEAREYDRFIELGDILATLRLKAERQLAATATS